jgi:predicted phage replisome organizer
MDVKWIKICTNIFDDEKILLIESMPDPDAIITIWFKLLCLAGKQNNHGVFMINDRIPFTDEMFAAIFRRNVATVRMALKIFEQFGMIEIVDGVVTIPNWEKHQSLDALEKRRESDRKRQQKKREEQKRLIAKAEEMKEDNKEESDENDDENCHVTVTEPDNVTVQNPCHVIIHSENRVDKNRLDKNRLDYFKENIKEKYPKDEIDEMFELLWDEIPNKKGEVKAKKYFINALKKGTTFNQILNGIRAYNQFVTENKVEEQFIKQGDNYFKEACWNNQYKQTENTKRKTSYDIDMAKAIAVPFVDQQG